MNKANSGIDVWEEAVLRVIDFTETKKLVWKARPNRRLPRTFGEPLSTFLGTWSDNNEVFILQQTGLNYPSSSSSSSLSASSASSASPDAWKEILAPDFDVHHGSESNGRLSRLSVVNQYEELNEWLFGVEDNEISVKFPRTARVHELFLLVKQISEHSTVSSPRKSTLIEKLLASEVSSA